MICYRPKIAQCSEGTIVNYKDKFLIKSDEDFFVNLDTSEVFNLDLNKIVELTSSSFLTQIGCDMPMSILKRGDILSIYNCGMTQGRLYTSHGNYTCYFLSFKHPLIESSAGHVIDLSSGRISTLLHMQGFTNKIIKTVTLEIRKNGKAEVIENPAYMQEGVNTK